MSALSDAKVLATAGAHQAAIGAAELLRFAREGEGMYGPFDDDTVEKLLDAAKLAMEVEGWNEHGADKGQVYGAVCKFLEGWA